MIECIIIIACVPPLDVIPVVVSWYDPAQGGINCDSDCSVLANMTPMTDDLYGVTAACPIEWIGQRLTLPGVGTFNCWDTGGKIHPAWDDDLGMWVTPVDLMYRTIPESFGRLIWDWNLN